MPHAAHWILGPRCRFHLATYVGEFIVSTVGECPVSGTLIQEDNPKFERVGGLGPEIYESYVTRAIKTESECCPWKIDVRHDKERRVYKTCEEATEGHMELCQKWADIASRRE